jgi:hypothetical protein
MRMGAGIAQAVQQLGYEVHNREIWVRFHAETIDFLFSTAATQALGLTSFLCEGYRGFFRRG